MRNTSSIIRPDPDIGSNWIADSALNDVVEWLGYEDVSDYNSKCYNNPEEVEEKLRTTL